MRPYLGLMAACALVLRATVVLAAQPPEPGQVAAPATPPRGDTAVIKPPANIDPGISKPPPDAKPEAGRMPVVPPPGTPGGDPTVIAK